MQDTKERLTERLKTSRYWVQVTSLESGMKLDLHGEIHNVEINGSRVYVTVASGVLPYRKDEKALLALPQTTTGRQEIDAGTTSHG